MSDDKPKRRRSRIGLTASLVNRLALFFGQEGTTTFRRRIALALIHGDIGAIRALTDKKGIDWKPIYANLCGIDPTPWTSLKYFYGLNRKAMAYVQQLANSEVEYPEEPTPPSRIDRELSAAFWKSIVGENPPAHQQYLINNFRQMVENPLPYPRIPKDTP